MKSYISRKFPLETRTTAQIFALRPRRRVRGIPRVSRVSLEVTGILPTANVSSPSLVVRGRNQQHRRLPLCYQITFNPSWIWRDEVEVWFSAVGKLLPSESKTELFCPN